MGRRDQSPFDVAVRRAARAAVLAAEPAELPLLDDILNPPRQFFRWRRQDAVGFGLDDAIQWASPYAVAAAIWYGKIVFEEGKSVVEERTKATVSKLLRRKNADVSPPPTVSPGERLTSTEVAEHVQRVRDYSISLGLDEKRAALLADAVVGSMLRGGTESDGDA